MSVWSQWLRGVQLLSHSHPSTSVDWSNNVHSCIHFSYILYDLVIHTYTLITQAMGQSYVQHMNTHVAHYDLCIRPQVHPDSIFTLKLPKYPHHPHLNHQPSHHSHTLTSDTSPYTYGYLHSHSHTRMPLVLKLLHIHTWWSFFTPPTPSPSHHGMSPPFHWLDDRAQKSVRGNLYCLPARWEHALPIY